MSQRRESDSSLAARIRLLQRGVQIDYQRIGQTITFDPAPYAQAGLKYRF